MVVTDDDEAVRPVADALGVHGQTGGCWSGRKAGAAADRGAQAGGGVLDVAGNGWDRRVPGNDLVQRDRALDGALP